MSKSHFSITQATILSVVGAIATAVVTLVPAWGPEAKIIVASIGGVVVAGFPFYNAIHKLADSILAGHQALANSNVSASEVERNAVAAAQNVLAHADLGPAVDQAIAAKNLPALEGVGRDELNRILVGMFPGMADLINSVLPAAAPAPVSTATGAPVAT